MVFDLPLMILIFRRDNYVARASRNSFCSLFNFCNCMGHTNMVFSRSYNDGNRISMAGSSMPDRLYRLIFLSEKNILIFYLPLTLMDDTGSDVGWD